MITHINDTGILFAVRSCASGNNRQPRLSSIDTWIDDSWLAGILLEVVIAICGIEKERIGVDHSSTPEEGTARIDEHRCLSTFNVGVSDSQGCRTPIVVDANLSAGTCGVTSEYRIGDLCMEFVDCADTTTIASSVIDDRIVDEDVFESAPDKNTCTPVGIVG